ncbi:MAG: TadE/TadG family type IV pilus assembly protein [Hyphomicrobium sp.]
MSLFNRSIRNGARFRIDRSGTIAATTALLGPVLLMLTGNVIDHARYLAKQRQLQDAIDAAALGAAKQLSLTNSDNAGIESVVKAIAASQFNGSAPGSASGVPVISTTFFDKSSSVEVTATLSFAPMFGNVFGFNAPEIRSRAVARVVGNPNICVLALDPDENGAISLEQQARVTGQNCAVYSNSSHATSIKAKNSASLSATFICTHGGKVGGKANFSPEPMTDCPSFEDPLSSRPEPDVGGCIANPSILPVLPTTLEPGTYCGGIEIKFGANVILKPGIYVIKDGPLLVANGSRMSGDGVGFYFTGDNATFKFENSTHISLTAPISGPMAGLLMFESRSRPTSGTFELMSDDAPLLLGTIYLPQGELRVDAGSPIAYESAYTAIVARAIRLYGGPHLVLNTSYDSSDVPVPSGIKGVGGLPTLSE